VTATLPPWSPLNDPQLSAQIQAGLQQEREIPRRNAQRDLYFLERYAWQEYPVKCGRWHRVDDPGALTSGTTVSGPWTKKTWTADLRWLLLFDPAGRQPIAAHTVNWPSPQQGATAPPVDGRTASIWFAGDPRVCGLFTPAGDGHTASFGQRAGSEGLSLWQGGAQRYEQLAANIATRPFADTAPPDYGPWLADQPQPPPAPKRFGAARG
jgi:hypothetical protein